MGFCKHYLVKFNIFKKISLSFLTPYRNFLKSPSLGPSAAAKAQSLFRVPCANS